MREENYYHAIALAFEGDRRKITNARRRASTWESAYRMLAATGAPLPDPEKEMASLQEHGIRLMLASDNDYPAALREIPDPPFGIYAKGTVIADPNVSKNFAIVGTRRATPQGKYAARRFAAALANAGFAIASGLAFGIDTAAHEGCLDAHGATSAVLANGLDTIYPKSNRHLAERILENGGSLVSEYPPGAPPFECRFLERNRLISGLSAGTLIIEAPDGSGALRTAADAVEQGRDVFVVPGPIDHPNFNGSHRLIRQGAELVTDPKDILDAYGIAHAEERGRVVMGASPEETLILKALREIPPPANIDKIIEATKLEPRIVNRAVSFLILRSVIKESGMGYIMN